MNNKKKIIDAINAVMGTSYVCEEIIDEMSLTDDLLFDSITMIQLIVELEEQFNISMDEIEDFSAFSTVESVCVYIDEKMKQ